MAEGIARATQHTERGQQSTGVNWPRTPQKQSNGRSRDTGEQEPSGPGHCTRKATEGTGTPVNRSQEDKDIAHATQHTEPAHR